MKGGDDHDPKEQVWLRVCGLVQRQRQTAQGQNEGNEGGQVTRALRGEALPRASPHDVLAKPRKAGSMGEL